MENRIRFIEIQFAFGFLGTDVLHSQATTLSVRPPKVIVYRLLLFPSGTLLLNPLRTESVEITLGT